MIQPNATARQVYLPAGNWFDFWNHTKHAGGQNLNWTNPNQAQFPLFVREGAVIPMLLSETDSLCDANYVNNAAVKTANDDLQVLIYPAGNSGFVVHDGTNVQSRADAGGTVIAVSSTARRFELQVLANPPAAVKRDGAALPLFASAPEFDAAASGWRVDAQTGIIFVKFQHSGGNTTVDLH
jgi:alpha-glucosidase (family GH31 glycosyl hydrolase)